MNCKTEPGPYVSVILPAFNERDNITALIAGIQSALGSAEIIVVDDDSPDGTGQLVARIASQEPRVRLVQRHQRGLTTALQRGIGESRGDIVFWMDCDLSMPPATMPLMLREIERGADVAIGSRYAPNGKDARGTYTPVLASALINLAAQVLLGGPVRDYTTGFVAARRRVLDRIPLCGDYGEYCIDFLTRAMRAGFRVAEVGYVCKPRVFGESKTSRSFLGFLTRGWPYVLTILRLALHRHPAKRESV